MSYGSQGRESLNILSPNRSDQEKHKKVSLAKIFILKVMFMLKTLLTCYYLIDWPTRECISMFLFPVILLKLDQENKYLD